jgi:tagatose 1,6-diphosphate aldolase
MGKKILNLGAPIMKTISLGKIRNLQACASENGVFTIQAIDHRDALRVLLNQEAPDKVSAMEMTKFKLMVINALAPAASALLLDPVYSAPQAIVTRSIPSHLGLLIALEEQGYLGDPPSRRTTILTDWSVEKAKRMGAQGIKMLLFFNPYAREAASAQIDLVTQIVAECEKFEIPLFLEPISYSIENRFDKSSAEFARLRPKIVIESARQLSDIGVDILKVEFPIDPNYEANPSVWAEACRELDSASQVPWVLLSGGESYETFRKQIQIACEAGCSGFLVGRAIWQEAIGLSRKEQERYLQEIALPRLTELGEIVRRHGTPWTDRYRLPEVDDNWFHMY